MSWRVEERFGTTTVTFVGNMDESVRFDPLQKQLQGRVLFHLEKVDRINSCGVREWVNLVRDLPKVTDLVFTHCSGAVVSQLTMVSNFIGKGRVESVFAPFCCEKCGASAEKLVPITSVAGGHTPTHPCDCGDTMAFDDMYDRYFGFLME
jgi:hypothetical protein